MKADRNGDGKISPDEFPDPSFKEAVRAIDRVYGNGDGAVDREEWDGALKLMRTLNSLVAVDLGGQQSKERWRTTRMLTDAASPLSYHGLLYLVKNGGLLAALLGEWSAQFSLTLQSGTPLTARVLGAATDLFRGVPTIIVVYLLAFGVPALGLSGIPNSAVFWGTVGLILVYTAIITIHLPEFWLHPYGPVLKNVPLLVVLLVLALLEPRR